MNIMRLAMLYLFAQIILKVIIYWSLIVLFMKQMNILIDKNFNKIDLKYIAEIVFNIAC